MKHIALNTYFVTENTTPVGFFYKLPKKIRQEYELLFKNFLEDSEKIWVLNHTKIVEYYFRDISPEKFVYIRETSPDYDYFIFCELFIILYPVIKVIVEKYDLYNKYPEYVL